MRRNKFLKHGNNISSLHETIRFGTVLQVNTLSHWVRLISYFYGCISFFVCNSLIEIQFTYHTIYALKVHNSSFSILRVVQPPPQVHFRTFHHFEKETL